MFNYKFSHILAYAPENLELNKWSFIVQNTSFIRICWSASCVYTVSLMLPYWLFPWRLKSISSQLSLLVPLMWVYWRMFLGFPCCPPQPQSIQQWRWEQLLCSVWWAAGRAKQLAASPSWRGMWTATQGCWTLLAEPVVLSPSKRTKQRRMMQPEPGLGSAPSQGLRWTFCHGSSRCGCLQRQLDMLCIQFSPGGFMFWDLGKLVVPCSCWWQCGPRWVVKPWGTRSLGLTSGIACLKVNPTTVQLSYLLC